MMITVTVEKEIEGVNDLIGILESVQNFVSDIVAPEISYAVDLDGMIIEQHPLIKKEKDKNER